jgi:hypothetical protein
MLSELSNEDGKVTIYVNIFERLKYGMINSPCWSSTIIL